MGLTYEPADKDEDAESLLVDLSRGGDKRAFERLVRRHQQRIRSLVATYVPQFEEADDLAQEVFLAAYRRLVTFRGEAPFGAWLSGIARMQVLRHLRATGRRNQHATSHTVQILLDEIETEKLNNAPDAMAARERELAALRGCVEGLPTDRADLVRRYYFGGGRLADIAAALGKNESATKVALFRIRQTLRVCIERRMAMGKA